MSRWKDVERDWAKKVGSKREGPQGKEGPDVRTEFADYEIKSFSGIVRWSVIKAAVDQVMQAGKRERLKAAVIYVPGSRDPYVVIRGSEFLSWTGADLRRAE